MLTTLQKSALQKLEFADGWVPLGESGIHPATTRSLKNRGYALGKSNKKGSYLKISARGRKALSDYPEPS